jgi:PilZ domain
MWTSWGAGWWGPEVAGRPLGVTFPGVPERRVTPRADVALPCVLRRRTGTAIDAETVNLGPGGMCIATPRPLATDEVLDFDLWLNASDHVDGRVRVLRHEGHGAYAMRFEDLLEPARKRLRALAGESPLA